MGPDLAFTFPLRPRRAPKNQLPPALQDCVQSPTVAGDIEDSSGMAKYGPVNRVSAFENTGKEWAQADDWRGARKAFSQVLINAARVTDDNTWHVLLYRNIAMIWSSAREGALQSKSDL